ncbi:DgyrCDS671 [Dimorphilus gyrociliatus]|uniref:DgyrCDS671 n=1 Tax=Dimorphilus gyrociliatus TaxID=2664684 RepID=A0A7I8V6L6_9ANNE|nr:DgyrCDS671 [Dimorphilus gyrociliatus]
MERQGVVRDEKTGELYIPATQRPNGTWRKPIRVKEGYIPPDEMPVYQNRGVRFRKEQESALPPGLHLDKPSSNENKTKKPKKKKKQREEEPSKPSSNEPKKKSTEDPKPEDGSEAAVQVISDEKKLRNLKKKLKQTEELENKIKSGNLEKPDPDQIKKIERKADLLLEIEKLEKLLNSTL